MVLLDVIYGKNIKFFWGVLPSQVRRRFSTKINPQSWTHFGHTSLQKVANEYQVLQVIFSISRAFTRLYQLTQKVIQFSGLLQVVSLRPVNSIMYRPQIYSIFNTLQVLNARCFLLRFYCCLPNEE